MTDNSTWSSTHWPQPFSHPMSRSSLSSFSTSVMSPTTTIKEGRTGGLTPSAIVEVTMMSIILAVALLGNICLILIIVTDIRLRTVHNKMVINLAICGLFTVIANGPFIVSTLAKEEWIYGDIWCQFNGFTTSVYGLAVVLTLAMISVNRYQIIGPVTPRRTPWITEKRIIFALTGVWFVSMLFALPPALGWSSYEFVHDRAICTLKWSTNISYTVFVFSLGIFFPFIVIFVSYFSIFRTVRANFRRMRSHRGSGKVYPRSEGAAGSSRRPTDASGRMGSRGSFARSSWSNGSRQSRFNNADTIRNEFGSRHLQLPPANGHLSRQNRMNNGPSLNGRSRVTRTVSDISSEIGGNGRSLFATSLARQLSLDRDILTISPCASASTLDHHEDEEESERESSKSAAVESNGRISDYLVQDTVESTAGPSAPGDLQSTEDSIRASRLYKRREPRGASGKVAIQLTSVEEPKTAPINFETSPVGALSLALAESSRGQNILQVQAALSADRFNHTRGLRPIPPSAQERPKTAGFYDVDKINNNNIRRLSVRSLRNSFRPSSARGRSQTLTSQNSTSASNNDELRMTLMVCAVLISFVLCWAPVTIVSFIAVLNVNIPAPVDKFAVFMMFLSSAVNPVIYGLMNRKFRVGFRRLLCGWRTGKSSSNGSNRSKTRSKNKLKKNGAGQPSPQVERDPETGITTRR